MSDQVRYSDEKLQEFETLIQEKITKTTDALNAAKGMQKDQKNTIANANVDFNESSKHFQQQATNKRMISRMEKKLADLNAALFRIENKTYGICQRTGDLIDEKRLQAMPTAKYEVSQ